MTKAGRIVFTARQVRLRKQADLGRVITVTEAAAGMGMDVAQLSRIERGQTSAIDFALLARFCAFYDAAPGDFLEYTERDETTDNEESPEGEELATAYALPTGLSSLALRPVLAR